MTVMLEGSIRRNKSTDSVLRAVSQVAVRIPSCEEQLFGWFHGVANGSYGRHGVVICPPLGYEHLHTHRALRHLANEFASRRIPTLRFDWSGHGDSAGSDEDPHRVSVWLQNTRDAVAWLRHRLGDAPVSVVGLRAGGLIAATALSEIGIENLVLWAPVVHGREYVREMKMIDRAGDAPRPAGGDSAGAIEAAGFLLTPETAGDLSALQIAKSCPQTRRINIIQRDDLPSDPRLKTWVTTLGIPAEISTLPGYTPMLLEPHRGQLPGEALQEISRWLHDRIHAPEVDKTVGPERLSFFNESQISPENDVVIKIPSPSGSYQERSCWIRRGPDLFGIVTEPVVAVESRPTIVLVNAGATYRIGPGRLNVRLARAFAQAGFRTLRVDLQGLGDSLGSDPAKENDPYARTVFGDIRDTFRFLDHRYGLGHYVVMGLCSGAYAAFQAAAQLPEPAFVEGILINPLTYYWRDGMTIEDNTTAREIYQQQHYLQSALQPVKWWKLLTGRSKIGLAGAMRLVLRKFSKRRTSERVPSRAEPRRSSSQPLGHPSERNLPHDLLKATADGRFLSFYFAENDPGDSILHSEAGATVRRLQADGRMVIHRLAHADHTFSRTFARQALITQLCNDLTRRYPPVIPLQ